MYPSSVKYLPHMVLALAIKSTTIPYISSGISFATIQEIIHSMYWSAAVTIIHLHFVRDELRLYVIV